MSHAGGIAIVFHLFSIPFVLIGLGLIYLCAATFVNRTTITASANVLSVRVGPAPLARRPRRRPERHRADRTSQTKTRSSKNGTSTWSVVAVARCAGGVRRHARRQRADRRGRRVRRGDARRPSYGLPPAAPVPSPEPAPDPEDDATPVGRRPARGVATARRRPARHSPSRGAPRARSIGGFDRVRRSRANLGGERGHEVVALDRGGAGDRGDRRAARARLRGRARAPSPAPAAPGTRSHPSHAADRPPSAGGPGSRRRLPRRPAYPATRVGDEVTVLHGETVRRSVPVARGRREPRGRGVGRGAGGPRAGAARRRARPRGAPGADRRGARPREHEGPAALRRRAAVVDRAARGEEPRDRPRAAGRRPGAPTR